MKVLFRADATPEIGSGHATRCYALAQELVSRNYTVLFLTTPATVNLLSKYDTNHINFYEIPEIHAESAHAPMPKHHSNKDIELLLHYVKKFEIDWIVLDGYKFDVQYQAALQENIKYLNTKLLLIDDIGNIGIAADIVLNQNFKAEKITNYVFERSCKQLLGTKYALLRKEFQNRKVLSETSCFSSQERLRILVTMGGSDFKNITKKTLEALFLSKINADVKVLIGSINPFKDELLKIESTNNLRIQFIEQSVNIAEEILWSTDVITAGGSTVWEIMSLERPLMVGGYANNQQIVLNQLEEYNLAYIIGEFNQLSVESFAGAIVSFVSDREGKLQRANRAKGICDANGCIRVVDILEEYAGNKK